MHRGPLSWHPHGANEVTCGGCRRHGEDCLHVQTARLYTQATSYSHPVSFGIIADTRLGAQSKTGRASVSFHEETHLRMTFLYALFAWTVVLGVI